MKEIAKQLNELTYDDDDYDSYLSNPAIYWRTKDRKYIRISDMEDSHIVNTINYFKRKSVPPIMDVDINLDDYILYHLGLKYVYAEGVKRGIIEDKTENGILDYLNS